MSEGNKRGLADLPLRPGQSPSPRADQAAPVVRHTAPPSRQRDERRRRPWLWLLLLPLVILLVLAVWYFARPVATADPVALDFGARHLGHDATVLTVELLNGGPSAMRIERVEVSGPGAERFHIEADGCRGRQVTAGASCRMEVGFVPDELGAVQGQLVVRGALRRTVVVELAGTGIAPRLAVTPSDYDYGAKAVLAAASPATFTLTNSGTATLTIDSVWIDGAEGDFRITANDCSRRQLEAAASCRLTVGFQPQVAGARVAALGVGHDSPLSSPSVTLRGEGSLTGSALTADPQRLTFGDGVVGGDPVRRTLRVTNRGESSHELSSVTVGGSRGGFRVVESGCSQRPIAPGETCRIAVAFTPQAEGAVAGELLLADPASPALAVPLAGRGIAVRLAAAESAIDLGAVRVGVSAAGRAVEVTNSGTASWRVAAVEISGRDAAAFSADAASCGERDVSPGDSCRLRVSVRPTRAGPQRAQLEIVSVPPGRLSVEISGAGTAPTAEPKPRRLDFGEVRRGTSKRQSVRMENRGTAPLVVAEVEIDAPEYRLAGSDCTRSAIPVAGACEIGVEFAPRGDGELRAQLLVRHDAPGGSSRIELSGRGLPPQPEFAVEPSVLSFGTHEIGRRSAIETVRIVNSGSGGMKLSGIQVDGPAAGDFQIVPGTCEGVPAIAPGSDCAFGLRFVPSAAGVRQGRLLIRHDAPGGRGAVPLSGRGRTPQPAAPASG